MVTTSRIWTFSAETSGKQSSSITVPRPSAISWRMGFPSSPGLSTGQTTSWWSWCHSCSNWWSRGAMWGPKSENTSSCTTTSLQTNIVLSLSLSLAHLLLTVNILKLNFHSKIIFLSLKCNFVNRRFWDGVGGVIFVSWMFFFIHCWVFLSF